jgi:hypothetical protein
MLMFIKTVWLCPASMCVFAKQRADAAIKVLKGAALAMSIFQGLNGTLAQASVNSTSTFTTRNTNISHVHKFRSHSNG